MSMNPCAPDVTLPETSSVEPAVEYTHIFTRFRLGILAGLAVLAGVASQAGFPGSVIALVPAGLLLVIVSPLNWRDRNLAFKLLLLLAAGLTLAIAIEPGALNLTLAWFTMALLVLIARGGSLQDLLQSLMSVLGQAVRSPAGSARAVRNARADFAARSSVKLDWRMAVLPVLSVLGFTVLFMASNDAFSSLVSELFAVKPDLAWSRTAIISLVVLQLLLAVTAITAARGAPFWSLEADAPGWHAVLFSPGSVMVTLVALNAVFLVQNLLDAQFLWSGMLGTSGNAYAAYAQRGAYTLIITILLAAALMIISLWPGSRTNASAVVRILVYIWILQNVFLLLSCAARLMFYVDAYGLTLLRLASFIWMGLIACGLILVALRVMLGRSNLWLVNANLAAAFLVLWASCFIDFRGAVAQYNISWSLATKRWDLRYIHSLGPNALPALSRLGIQATNPLVKTLEAQQSDWRHWTLRGHIFATAIQGLSLPGQQESEMVPECQTASTKADSSTLSPSSSVMNSQGGDCPVPNSQPAPR
jgi:hypothetical protein